MTDAIKTLAQLKKAEKLIRLNMHKNGPRSYRRGIGALLRAITALGEPTQYELIEYLGWSRHNLKNVVKKAAKRDFVEFIDSEEPRTYSVKITEIGTMVMNKREAANKAAAEKLIGCLTEEEVAQLNTITEKIIVAAKEDGEVSAFGKGHKFHKGHKGHRPHAELA